MTLKSKDKRKFSSSIKNCLEGINFVITNESNFKKEIVIGIIALLLSYILKISRIEFIIILIMIALVLTSEIINTSIEKVVDLYTKDYNNLAKIAKDVSAGSVLVMSIFSLLVGATVFLPKIINVLGG